MTPGIPGLPLPHKHRPAPSNPLPHELGTVDASYGRASFRGPAWVFVLLLVAVLIAGNVYFASRRPPEDPSGVVHDVREQMSTQTEAMRKLEQLLTHRLDGLETKVDRLQDSQDRVRERVTALENRR